MHFEIWLGVSFGIFCCMLIGAFVLSKLAYKRGRILTHNKLLTAGTFLTAVVLLLPIYLEQLFEVKGFLEYAKCIMLSVLHAVRLFAFDGGYANSFESDVVRALAEPLSTLYSVFGACLYIFAPMITLKFVLSFFKNADAYRRYVFSSKDAHVFSELNEKSLALARSIDEKYNKKDGKYKLSRKALIVFNGTAELEEKKNDLLEGAKEIGAICFSKDITAIKYSGKGGTKRRINFYLISENENEKIRQTEKIMERYDFSSVELHIFSDDIRCELILAAQDVSKMKVIRVNETRSLVYHTLDAYGMRLFENARTKEDGEKVISAVVVGLGKCGTEMVKALSWFSQMDGYRLKLKVLDSDKNARDKFTRVCPELLSDEINGKRIKGEARYDIDIVGGVDVNSTAFDSAISEITDATYIFISLGSDVENLNTAVKVRTLSERVAYPDGQKPDIETVIYDSHAADVMSEKWEGDSTLENERGVTNFKNEPYRIHMIGSLKQLYSVDVMLNSTLVQLAEESNARYAQYVYEDGLEKAEALAEPERSKMLAAVEKQKADNLRAFYKYDYNYSSTLARIIHERKSTKLGLKNPECEHRRWNAYMRGEGYIFSGSLDSSSRNDLAKLHHNLIPYKDLTEKVDIKKDE